VVGAVGQGSLGRHFPELLVEALRCERAEVATAALSYVRASTDQALRKRVEGLVRDVFRRDNDALKLRAATVLLQQFGSTEARDHLLSVVEGTDRNARYQALSALASTNNSGKEIDKRVLEVLRGQLNSPETTAQRLAAQALAGYRGDAVLDSLIPLLADKQRSRATYVGQSLMRYPDKDALRKRLKVAAKDEEDEKLRAAAEKLLQTVGR
jgi:hypothetical protein